MDIDLSNVINNRKPNTDNTCIRDGLLFCKICNRPREKLIKFMEKEYKVAVLCKCESDEIKKEEEQKIKEDDKREYEKRKNLISSGYRDIFIKDSNTELKSERNYIKKFAEMQKQNIGLMYFGKVGNGKTFRASVIANELCKVGYRVLMQHVTEALNNITKFDNEYYCKLVADVSLLIIDDFGAERSTDYQIEALNKLIDLRYQVKKPIIITTNIERSVLADEKDIRLQRTYNRLIEMTHPIKITTENRRINIAQNRYTKIKSMLEEEE